MENRVLNPSILTRFNATVTLNFTFGNLGQFFVGFLSLQENSERLPHLEISHFRLFPNPYLAIIHGYIHASFDDI
jgi:hypothetical protein